MTYIGINISKSTFVTIFHRKTAIALKHSRMKLKAFASSLADTHHCVMEVTGNYGFLLFYFLDRAGIAASLVNPKRIKNYSRVMMSVTKIDEMDVLLIAD
ncbi:IS110 family transposase [Bacteroides heparinolyticus]|uniref:IS110 family transposase n=1 Tax=Prevotella heparinolytica TaxID=28113 RepID=UPI0035A06B46